MGGQAPISPHAYQLAVGETLLRARTLRLPFSNKVQSIIEIIRFAAANRLCVDLDYAPEDGARGIRRIEPYSLRETAGDDVVLHIEKPGRNQHRTYRIDRIVNAQVTNETFIPRHEIELLPEAPIRVPRTERRASASLRAPSERFLSGSRSRPSQSAMGPTYVYECTACGKKFNRKRYGATLNAHKDKRSRYPCYGRIGRLVDTKY